MNCRITTIVLSSVVLLFVSGCTIGDPSPKGELAVSEVCTLPASYYEDKGIDAANKLHFAIDRSKLYVGWILDTSLVCQLAYILDKNPDVRTLVLTNISDSVDPKQTRKAALFLRSKRITTVLSPGAIVRNGGIDLFLWGVTRQLGDENNFTMTYQLEEPTLASLDMSNPAHVSHLDFYATLGIPTGFYRDMLEKASNETYRLSLQDMMSYWFLTKDSNDSSK